MTEITTKKPVIGITMGDAAGIGPEIVRAALASGRLSAEAEYSVIGPSLDCFLGQPTPHTARAASQALEEAVQLALRGEIAIHRNQVLHPARLAR